MNDLSLSKEWLEPDGLGGFASGTVNGIRTRRYHALLLTATTPPTGRYLLVNGFDAWVETPSGRFDLSSQRYAPDATFPDGAKRIDRFRSDPWPRWTFRLEDGTRIEQEALVPRGRPAVILRWSLDGTVSPARLSVRPFFSGREEQALHHQNPAFRFDVEHEGRRFVWRPYPGVPPIVAVTAGAYGHDPRWYWNFQYDEERDRGLDFKEDLVSPGTFTWELSAAPATLGFTTEDAAAFDPEALREAEGSRRSKSEGPGPTA